MIIKTSGLSPLAAVGVAVTCAVIVAAVVALRRIWRASRAHGADAELLQDSVQALRAGGASLGLAVTLRDDVLGDAGCRCYAALVRLWPDHEIWALVSLGRVLEVGAARDSVAVSNALSRKSVDFLVMTSDHRPVIAVDLDDLRARRRSGKDHDSLKSNALARAGLPLLRVSAERIPPDPELRARCEHLLSIAEAVRTGSRAEEGADVAA